MGTKIRLFMDNAGNAARQAAATAASFAVRSEAYMAGNPPVPASYTDDERLRIPGGVSDNEVAVSTQDGVEIRITDAVIKVEQTKKILSTALLNRNGTVKEYIQDGDYTVTVSGSIIGEQGKFPYAELNDVIVPIMERAESLKMSSRYTDAFGISEVVLTKATFDQNQMRLFNVLPFALEFLSDRNYEFLVEE